MSRTGKKPIQIPDGVEVQIKNNHIRVKGPHGELCHDIPSGISAEQDEQQILVKKMSNNIRHRSLHGLTRTLIYNMICGVTEKFSKTLELVGVGYRATIQGNKLSLIVGLSHPAVFEVEDNLNIEVPVPTKIIISGIDKQQVGNFAAKIRSAAPPEPYKGKGIKYENEYIRKKVGKAGK
ncbi:MAG: 50S ribosomal protein L6 [Dethiobacteria bacterium]